MPKCFAIDFVRQILEQKLLEEHNKNANFFGGKDQVAITSFYEQLVSQEDVDRFVETYRDLSEQQNRMGLILNGTLIAPENPTITNLYSSTIIPMEWVCNLRCTIQDRDSSVETIDNLISKLKGRKVDIAQLNCTNGSHVPFMVGTIGQYDTKPKIKNGDYIGSVQNDNDAKNVIDRFIDKGVDVDYFDLDYLYCEHAHKLKVLSINASKDEDVLDGSYLDDHISDGRYIVGSYDLLGEWTIEELYPNASANVYLYGDNTISLTLDNGTIEILEVHESNGQKYTKVQLLFDLGGNAEDLCPGFDGTFDIEDVAVYTLEIDFAFINNDGQHKNIIFPPEHDSFEKYKCSLSFDAIRCDEPRNLNAKEFCEISFGGSATLVNKSVRLGNDLLKIKVARNKVVASTPITFSDTGWYLEPLEMPSGSNASTNPSQLVSNMFKTNSHTDAIALTLQYTFIMDESISILDYWFDYARYGTQDFITPNIIYDIEEYWCSWGDFKNVAIQTKLVENIDIENTESDTLTLSMTMQIQGENN